VKDLFLEDGRVMFAGCQQQQGSEQPDGQKKRPRQQAVSNSRAPLSPFAKASGSKIHDPGFYQDNQNLVGWSKPGQLSL